MVVAFLVLQFINSWRKLSFSFHPFPSLNNVGERTGQVICELCTTFCSGRILLVPKTLKANNFNYCRILRTCLCPVQVILHKQLAMELFQMLVD